MKYLCKGQESLEDINDLLKLSNTQEDTQTGIIDHYVKNFSVSQAASINGLNRGNLSVAITDLNRIAWIVEQINERKVYGKGRTS